MNEVSAAINSVLAGGTALVALIADVLNGGTAPAIYQVMAPQGAALPYVVFSKQSGGPENLDPHDRRDLTYFVRGYATDAKAAGAIDGAISNLLHKHNIAVTGWNTISCVRDTDLESVDMSPADTPVHMAGAFYRIRIT